jgi:hypothetical protein
MTTPSCSFFVPYNRSICTRQIRYLATSAQKRKWLQEQGRNKPFVKKKYAALAEKVGVTTMKRKNSKSTENNWKPLFFLGVFPVFMSIVVVLSRDDLREEVNAKGIGRFLEDYKRWRRKPPPTVASMEHQQGEQESEYNKMLNHLELQKANVASTTFVSGDESTTDSVRSKSSNK